MSKTPYDEFNNLAAKGKSNPCSSSYSVENDVDTPVSAISACSNGDYTNSCSCLEEHNKTSRGQTSDRRIDGAVKISSLNFKSQNSEGYQVLRDEQSPTMNSFQNWRYGEGQTLNCNSSVPLFRVCMLVCFLCLCL